ALQRTEDLLALAPCVRLRSVEQVQPGIQTDGERIDDVGGPVLLTVVPIFLISPGPAAHPERGDLDWTMPKPAFLDCICHCTRARFQVPVISAIAFLLAISAVTDLPSILQMAAYTNITEEDRRS